MKKHMKIILLGLTMLFGLTGCLSNPNNLSDKEIVDQIKVKMKEEMDKIHFEVNFEDYEFKVNTSGQIQASFGNVTIKDKRYGYEPIRIYEGSFKTLEKDEIGVNPIIFVAHGYQDYVDNILLNDKKRGNNLDEALRISKGEKSEIYNFGSISGVSFVPSGDVVSVKTAEEAKGEKGSYYILPDPLPKETYKNFFSGKKSNQVDYNDFVETMNYVVLVVIQTSEKNVEELQSKVQQYCNKEYVTFVVRKGE